MSFCALAIIYQVAARPESEIDRDGAVRWVRRYVIQADYQKAILVAETILALGPLPYPSFITNPVVWQTELVSEQQEHTRETLIQPARSSGDNC